MLEVGFQVPHPMSSIFAFGGSVESALRMKLCEPMSWPNASSYLIPMPSKNSADGWIMTDVMVALQ